MKPPNRLKMSYDKSKKRLTMIVEGTLAVIASLVIIAALIAVFHYV